MDDVVKVFAKNEKELKFLIHAFRICSQDIGMEFGKEKCVMLSETDRIEGKNKVIFRTLRERKKCKYLGILKADITEQVEMKEKIKKSYLRRTRKLLETKLSSWNLIKGINNWAVHSLDIQDTFESGPEKDLIKWTKEQEN